MASPLSRELLHAPAALGARVVALGFLERADDARKQLASTRDADEVEAIHDFRVALRRLRSWLRSHRSVFDDDVPPKLRRRLRELAQATGACRDIDVQMEWITRERRTCTPGQRVGVTALLARLDERRCQANDSLRREINRDYDRGQKRLETVFSSYTTEVRTDEQIESWSVELARLLHQHALALHESLTRVRTPAQSAQAHEARIAGKRLRYLLEPIAQLVEGGREIASELEQLQDVLGDLHDAHVLAQELENITKAGLPTDERAGVRAIQRRLHTREALAFAQLRATWLHSAPAFFFARLEVIAAELPAAGLAISGAAPVPQAPA